VWQGKDGEKKGRSGGLSKTPPHKQNPPPGGRMGEELRRWRETHKVTLANTKVIKKKKEI